MTAGKEARRIALGLLDGVWEEGRILTLVQDKQNKKKVCPYTAHATDAEEPL